MEWLGWVALVALFVIARRLIFHRWRRYDLSHGQAAALLASSMPLVLVAHLAVRGVDSPEQLLLFAGIGALTFGSTYVFARFFLRWIGGEMDLPTSPSYRRRP